MHHQTFKFKMREIQNLLSNSCGCKITNVESEPESAAYCAHTFDMNGARVLFRFAKKTPTKTGYFVAMWKRDEKGKTAAFEITDTFQFYMIATQNGSKIGVFIFPKEILFDRNILASSEKSGKRGFRVYAPWDLVTSDQARKTQIWQSNYFNPLS